MPRCLFVRPRFAPGQFHQADSDQTVTPPSIVASLRIVCCRRFAALDQAMPVIKFRIIGLIDAGLNLFDQDAEVGPAGFTHQSRQGELDACQTVSQPGKYQVIPIPPPGIRSDAIAMGVEKMLTGLYRPRQPCRVWTTLGKLEKTDNGTACSIEKIESGILGYPRRRDALCQSCGNVQPLVIVQEIGDQH